MNIREWALPVYTILIQLTVGALIVLWAIRHLTYSKFKHVEMDKITRDPILVIVFTVVVAMIGAHFHLSKPFLSFYASRNFLHSWLSREIVFTMLFFLASFLVLILSRFYDERRRFITTTGWVAVFFGVILVYCMARIYMLPTQIAWNSPWVVVSFYNTTLLLGAITIISLLVLDLKFSEIQNNNETPIREKVIEHSLAWLIYVVIVTIFISLAVNLIQIADLSKGDLISTTSLQLLLQLYYPLLIMRGLTVIIAAILLGFLAYQKHNQTVILQNIMTPVFMSCLLILIGEIIGRFLFYATHIRVGI